jgi:hypothetical protein
VPLLLRHTDAAFMKVLRQQAAGGHPTDLQRVRNLLAGLMQLLTQPKLDSVFGGALRRQQRLAQAVALHSEVELVLGCANNPDLDAAVRAERGLTRLRGAAAGHAQGAMRNAVSPEQQQQQPSVAGAARSAAAEYGTVVAPAAGVAPCARAPAARIATAGAAGGAAMLDSSRSSLTFAELRQALHRSGDNNESLAGYRLLWDFARHLPPGPAQDAVEHVAPVLQSCIRFAANSLEMLRQSGSSSRGEADWVAGLSAASAKMLLPLLFERVMLQVLSEPQLQHLRELLVAISTAGSSIQQQMPCPAAADLRQQQEKVDRVVTHANLSLAALLQQLAASGPDSGQQYAEHLVELQESAASHFPALRMCDIPASVVVVNHLYVVQDRVKVGLATEAICRGSSTEREASLAHVTAVLKQVESLLHLVAHPVVVQLLGEHALHQEVARMVLYCDLLRAVAR